MTRRGSKGIKDPNRRSAPAYRARRDRTPEVPALHRRRRRPQDRCSASGLRPETFQRPKQMRPHWVTLTNGSVVERVVKLAESCLPPFCFSEAEIATKATFARAGRASASARTSGPFRRPSSRSMRQLVSSVKRVATMDDANGSARLFPLACLDRSALLSLLRLTAQTAVLRLPARTLSPWPPDSAGAGRRAR